MGNTQYEEILEKYKRWLRIERRNSKNTVDQMVRVTIYFLKWLCDNNKTIDDINQSIVESYLSTCYDKYAGNTMVLITANLRKFCQQFLGKEVNIKVAKIVPPNRDKTALTKQEILAIFKAANDNPLHSALIRTLYYTGLRASELVNLDLSDIDFDRLKVTVKHGKGNTTRTINITEDCANSLQKWINVRPKPKKGHENALFITLNERKRISTCYLRHIIKQVASQSGIVKQVYPHKFRISMITHMAENGCTLNEIQAQSGHKNISVLVGYIQQASSRIRKAYDDVFANIENDIYAEKRIPEKRRFNNEQYKKLAVKKYLEGEVDEDTLYSILTTLQEKENNKRQIDPSYV